MGMIGNAPVAGIISGGNVQDGSITNADLAAGVAVANLGYTPVNKAGDTMSSTLYSTKAAAYTTAGARFALDKTSIGNHHISAPEGGADALHCKVFGTTFAPYTSGQTQAGVVFSENGYDGVGVGFFGSSDYAAGPSLHGSFTPGGIFTTPNNPGFYAYANGGSVGAGSAASFTVAAAMQRGSSYSSGSGRFTAPVSGMYYAFFNAVPVPSDSGFTIYITKNGGDFARTYGYGNSYNGCSCSAPIYLAQNDYLQYWIQGVNGQAAAVNNGEYGAWLIG